MIIGCFIRGYKIFSNINFVKFFGIESDKLAFFIGDNGSGKSSILEALDVVFNGRKWNYNIGSKKSESFICPLFLIKKNDYRGKTDIISKVSDFFWGFSEAANNLTSNEAVAKFIEFRDLIRNKYTPADYYMVAVGFNFDNEIYFTSFIDKKLRNSLKPKSVSNKDLDLLGESIISLYRYIYFPVNVEASDMLAIQSNSLQGLMDKDILEQMEELLGGSGKGILSDINSQLDDFLRQVNDKLNKDGYVFSTPTIGKKNVSVEDITDAIVNSYFNLRVLQKEKTPVMNLSSGEQRRALIDVATAFITNSANRKKKLIFGVDEPEASLSVNACFDQFRKVAKIAESSDTQVIVATHWYGVLMTSMESALHHLSNKESRVEIKTFDLASVHEQRRRFPAAVEMKSFFDLMATIFSVIKLTDEKWIICEGSDDRNYLNKLISDDSVNVLPVGGVGNVVKLFNYFNSILISDDKEVDLLKGKILFLMDSDFQRIEVEVSIPNAASNHIKILRFQMGQDGTPSLVIPAKNGYYSETELEDCLNSQDYFEAAKEVISNSYPNFYKNFKYNENSRFAKINHGLEFLSLRHINGDNDRVVIKSILTDRKIKFEISKNYVYASPLGWVDTIRDFFNS